MDLFSKFTELAWFTLSMVLVALAGGALALIKKSWAKPVLIAAGIAEGALIAALLVFYFRLKDVTGTVFKGVDMSKTAFALSVIGLVIVMLALMFVSGRKTKWTARDIATAAMVVAMSFLLSCIKLWEAPQGGTITPASLLPMMIYIVAFGPARGLVVGFAYGLLQLVQGAYVVHPAQLLLDYPLAFGALALGGVVRAIPMRDYFRLPAAIAIGFAARLIMHTLSGVIFFASYAGDQNVWVYSSVYNATYLGPDMAVCLAISLIPGIRRIAEAMRKR